MQNKVKTQKKKKKNNSGFVKELREGSVVTVEYLKRYAWLLLGFIAVIISLIALRYKTKTMRLEIKELQQELVLAESLKLEEKAKYMSLIRENEMLRMVNEKKLGLSFQEQPPFVVKLDSIKKQ